MLVIIQVQNVKTKTIYSKYTKFTINFRLLQFKAKMTSIIVECIGQTRLQFCQARYPLHFRPHNSNCKICIEKYC